MSDNSVFNSFNGLLVCKGIDNSIRWKPGERLDQLFEERCDYFEKTGQSCHLAVISDNVSLTYTELDQRANQLAHFLLNQGYQSEDRTGLLFNKSVNTYIALLAVRKINAAYGSTEATVTSTITEGYPDKPVTIGNYCNLNDFSTLQSHSLESGIFRSDYINIVNGCTIEGNAYVHYDVTLEDNVILNPDSFLM